VQAEPIDDVLVVGTGSGFLTTCIARLAKHVVSVDIIGEFVAAARARLAEHEVRNVSLEVADALELSRAGQFDVVAVTASVPQPTDHFIKMLRPQGRLFIVVGREPVMEARLITMQPNGSTTTEDLFETVLTPLINAERPEPFVL
jgi:protein-L-isoaspartate(D-aspartate) O-methyltransferase